MSSIKEKAERAVNKIDRYGVKKVAGEHSLTAGELVFTLIGLGVIAYALMKHKGNKWIIAGLAVIVIGELIW